MSNDPNHPLYWRSLEERAEAPAFLRQLEAEFPEPLADPGSDDKAGGIDRRRFLKLMGASIALASLSGCEWPEEEIIPFGRRPEGYQPGRFRRYASALEIAGVPRPVLVSSYDGRPIKIEGNPLHAESLGATDLVAQAAVLALYDPERARHVRRRHGGASVRSSWEDFEAYARAHLGERTDGRKLAVLCEATTSPSLARMRRALERRFPGLTWCTHDPLRTGSAERGVALAWATPGRMRHHVDAARVVVDFEADLVGDHPEAVRLAREFARGRDPHADMNRLYVFEPTLTVTGAAADHRAAVEATAVGPALCAVALRLLDRPGLPRPQALSGIRGELESVARRADLHAHADLLNVVARDLVEHAGSGLVALGPRHPAALQAVAARVNESLGNVGRAVTLHDELDDRGADLAALTAQIDAGRVDTLVIMGGNPVYDAPADLGLAGRLERVEHTIHLAEFRNETSGRCRWFLPRAHALESWGDARATNGSLCPVQPLIAPLHGGRTALEILALLAEQPAQKGHEIVRDTFHRVRGGTGSAPPADPVFENAWRRFLHDGWLADSETTPRTPGPGVDDDLRPELRRLADTDPAPSAQSPRLHLMPDRKLLDGRFAGHAWLQELPDPLTKLTWDNAALMSTSLAETLGVEHGDVVRLEGERAAIELPAMVMPGQANHTITVALGYGRTEAGDVGTGVGVNAYPLRTSETLWGGLVSAQRTGRRVTLACTQDHFAIDSRGFAARAQRVPTLVREGTLAEYRHHPEFAQHLGPHHPPLRSLWEERTSDGHRWGMTIDLNRCTGCSACVMACVAENNTPVVGKEQVARGREMHWLRIDRYFKGTPEQPEVLNQPVACNHCELAPCEQVCPVGATMHSEEGLNVMAYNRCVGTRYCSNNCPYKVRRFNFFDYRKDLGDVEKLGLNPEVTVRSRGVMEKCTYCVQRIEHARIDAKNEGRAPRDGEIVPACQQTCPTEAIVFGDLGDADSRVSHQRADDRSYALLGELNVKPRTTYLARIRNPHPDLSGEDHGSSADDHHG